MKLTIIGCSGSMSGPESAASSYLVQAEGPDDAGRTRTWSVVFDLGPGAFGALWKYLNPQDLDAVVFTHGHSDHMGDIISLYVHNRWNPAGQAPVCRIYGPDNIAHRMCQLDGWATPEEISEIFDVVTVQPEVPFQVGPMTITPYRARHTVETFGYRVEAPGAKSLAFTGDTDTCESITRMALGVDLLLSEAAFTSADTVRGIHLDGERAGELATEAGVGQLVLTHIQPWTDPSVVLAETERTWAGPLEAARPGQVFEL